MLYSYDRTNDDDDAASDVSTENFSSGENVLLDGKTKARVAYFGPVHFSHDNDWVGIAFEEPVGKHSGSIAGSRYFKCDPMHGLFVRSHRLERIDSSGYVTARVKSPYRIRPKSSASMRSEGEIEDDVFTRAKESKEPLGFYEVRAGTIRHPDQNDEINNKLSRVVDELKNEDDKPMMHTSRRKPQNNFNRF